MKKIFALAAIMLFSSAITFGTGLSTQTIEHSTKIEKKKKKKKLKKKKRKKRRANPR
ncbi:MAG: hypothetical protein GY827_03795 [Cytophagales bacterium]|nr:hypothetical protein [Cytophagales bacterium]